MLDSSDGGVHAIDGAAFADHRDHLVNPRTDGAAGKGDADRLRELSEFEIEARQDGLEYGLHLRFVELARAFREFSRERTQWFRDFGLQEFRRRLRIELDVVV